MRKSLLIIVLCAAYAVGSSGCATTNIPNDNTTTTSQNLPSLDAGRAVQNIRVGMTEPQLIEAVGQEPDLVEMQTCGGATPKPWQCKVVTFFGHAVGNNLHVYMSKSDSTVNSWYVY